MNESVTLLLKDISHCLKVQHELGKQRIFLGTRPETSEKEVPFKASNFEDFRAEVLSCQKCALSKGRTQVVFGVGSLKAELMFIGEAPGFDEDRLGEPFVGKAGQLLTKMIEAMGLKRQEVYIANIVKCRPPGNRTPMPEEMAQCYPYLQRQIEVIRPKVICGLGNVAVQTLLNTEQTISKLRGMFYDFQGIKLMPTFHPAYLLRNPEFKREVWRDLQMVMDELGLEAKSKNL